MQLRPYQQEAKEAIFREWDNVARTLLVLPTGTGKTIVFAKVAEDLVAAGGRVLVLAHRQELLQQAADKIMHAAGLACSVEKAERTAAGEWYRITVGSVQTLMRPDRLERFPADYYQTVIVDEAHHALADSYQRVLGHFDGARVLGVTATPDRGDMRNLGQYFESLAYEYSLPNAIKEGYLAPIRALTIPLKLDLTGVKVTAGDFQAADLGNALDPYLHLIADEMAEHCRGRKTVAFLPLVATSRKMRDFLNARGFRAGEVNGESRDREEVLRDFHDGRYDVLCNSMLLTEGWDEPAVDCIVCLRPTKIRSLYCQIVGRGTRPSPETGKDHLLLLDFLWNSERHELCRPACLIAEDADVSAKMTQNLEEAAGCAVDLETAEQQAESDCIAEREEALAKQLAAMRTRKRRLVDPLQFEMSIAAEDLVNYVPSFGWEIAPATDKQRVTLERLGILPDDVDTAGKAAKLLDRLDKRRNAGLATPRQIRVLEQKGFRSVGTWQFEEARRLIDRIAANRWHVPAGVVPATYQPAEVVQ